MVNKIKTIVLSQSEMEDAIDRYLRDNNRMQHTDIVEILECFEIENQISAEIKIISRWSGEPYGDR